MENKDILGIRAKFAQMGLEPLQIIGDPNSEQGARGVRGKSSWYPSYDELRKLTSEYVGGLRSDEFPQGIRSGGMYVNGGVQTVIKDIGVEVGEDGFPKFNGLVFQTPDGKEYRMILGAGPKGEDITVPHSGGPLNAGPQPDANNSAIVPTQERSMWDTLNPVNASRRLWKDTLAEPREVLFGPSEDKVRTQTKPTPRGWSDSQVKYYHATGQLPPADNILPPVVSIPNEGQMAGHFAKWSGPIDRQIGSANPTWDDIFYSTPTPIKDASGKFLRWGMPGEQREDVPSSFRPWEPQATLGEQAVKMDGALGAIGYASNPITQAKDIIQNFNIGGDTIGNRVAGALNLQPYTQLVGDPNAAPQQEFFQKQLINNNDNGWVTSGKVGYNVLAGLTNVGLGVAEFLESPLGRGTRQMGQVARGTQAALPAAYNAGPAQFASALNKARLAAVGDTALQSYFLYDVGHGAYQTGKNMFDLVQQGQTANALSQVGDLAGGVAFTGMIGKHAVGNIPLLTNKGMHQRGAEIALNGINASSAMDPNSKVNMDAANLRTLFDDYTLQANRLSYGGANQDPSFQIDPITYGLHYKKDPVNLSDLLVPESQPLKRSPRAVIADARMTPEQRERLRVEAELNAQGFTQQKGFGISEAIKKEIEAEDARREELRKQGKPAYGYGEQMAGPGVFRGVPARPGEKDSKGGADPEFVRRAQAEAAKNKGQTPVPGVDPKTGVNLPTTAFDPPTPPRGTAQIFEPSVDSTAPLEAGTNIETQRGPVAASARQPDIHAEFVNSPSFRSLVDTAAVELGLKEGMSESTDTGIWVGRDNNGQSYTQMNPASSFRFKVAPGTDLNDYSRRLGQFASALSYAHGQEAVAWNIIRHDIMPNVRGNYLNPDGTVREGMNTGVQLERSRTFNKPEIEAMSKEVVRILKDELQVPDQGDNIGVQGYANGLRFFDFSGNITDKSALAQAVKLAYDRTVGRETGHNAGIRLIAYESKYESHNDSATDTKPSPGSFGLRYGQLLGMESDAGISPRLRRAIDAATTERNRLTSFYSGLGGRGPGITAHPQSGEQLAGGSPVRATPLALTGDRQLSLPPRPALPTTRDASGVNAADTIPPISQAGRAPVSLPGRPGTRNAIPQPVEGQGQKDVGSLTGLGNQAGRPMGGDKSTAQSLNLRQTIERIRQQDNVDLSVDVFNQNGYSVVRVMAKGRDGNTYEVSKVSGEIVRDDRVDGPIMYLSSFSTKTGMEGKGILQGVLSEFIHRANNEASAAGLQKLNYRLLDVSREGKSTRALGNVAGPENTTVDSIKGRHEKYPAWRARLEENKKTSKQYQAEFEALSLLAEKNDADYDAGKIKVEEYLAESRRIQNELERFDNRAGNHDEATLSRPSYGANSVSMLYNRSLKGGQGENKSVDEQLSEAYAEVRRLEDERDSGQRNPRRVQMDIDALEDTINDLHAKQDAEARLRMNPNQARLLPPRAEVELMNLRRLMRDVSDGKVSTGMAAEGIQRSIDKLVDRTSISKEAALGELRKIQGIDPAFLDIASRRFDEREAAKNAPAEPVKGGTTGRDRVRDPLAKPQVWERRQERSGPEALTETGDPSRLTYDELVDLQTRLEKNKGSADPDLLRAVTEEMQNRHRQYGNEGERNTALGGFVPETTPKSQLNEMVRGLPEKIRSDRERLSELNKRDGRNRSPEAAQLATEIKVNEERLRAAKVELNARARQQGNWERLDRTRIVQRESQKETFENPDVDAPRVKRDPVQALNWARGRFDRLTIDELMQARDTLKQQGRPYWKEVEKAINERRKAMPEMRREEGRTTDIVPENMTRSELEAEVDRLSMEVEANDARVSEMQAARASAAEIAAVRSEVDLQRGRLSDFQAEVANRDRIETTDFRRENEKQIGGHQQFRHEMAARGRGKRLEIVGRTEGASNRPNAWWEEEARYYGLPAGVRDVVNMTFRGQSKVREVLERIVKNSKSKNMQGIDPELGRLAEFLLKNQDHKSLEVVVGAWGKSDGEASAYIPGWRPESGNLQGGTKFGAIKYSREQLADPKTALETVMHEIVHSATADKVNRAIFGTAGIITDVNGRDPMGSTGTRYLDRLRAYAQQQGGDKAVKKLVQTYLKVLSEQKDNSKPISVDNLKDLRDGRADKNIFGPGSDMQRLADAGQYPLADLNEFITHASTDPNFKAYLKTIKMGNTDAWSRFKDSVKKILGVEGDTALDRAMESILEISSRDLSSFEKPGAGYYGELFDVRVQRKVEEGMSEADAIAATQVEMHPRAFDAFGVGKMSVARGAKDVEADIEELSAKGKKSGYTPEEVARMNELLDENITKNEEYDAKAENSPEFQRAKSDLEADLGREATHDEVIQEMDFRETQGGIDEYNYRKYKQDRSSETKGKTEEQLMDRLRQEPGMEGKLPENPSWYDAEMDRKVQFEAATSMGHTNDFLEQIGVITREQRKELYSEFAPGSFERRDELYQSFVELGGDTGTRKSSEIPADVQKAFKERHGFEYKPEDAENLGEPLKELGNGDTKSLGNSSLGMSRNKSFLREEAQASINVVKKGIEGLKRAKDDLTDKETFLQHGVDLVTASFLRASQAQLDVLADRRQSPTLRKVSELLNSTLPGRTDKAGSLGFHTAVSRGQLQMKNDLANALRPFESELKLKDVDGQKQFLEELGHAVVQPGLPSDPKMAKAVTDLRALYKRMYHYQIRAGIKLDNAGETYVPRMLDNEKVLADRYGFLNAAQKAYETTGMDPVEARDAAAQWYDSILRGDSGFSFDQKFVFDSSNLNGEPKHTRSRKFNKVAEGFMEKYYNRNIMDATLTYIGRAVKNAEIARRFGEDFEVYQGFENALISEGNRTALKEMNNLVANQLGTNQLKDYKGQGIINFLNAYSAIHFLPRATLSSIGEPLVAGLRTGNVVDSLTSMGNSLIYMKRKLFNQDPDYFHKLSQDIGVVVSELSGQAVSSSVSSRYWSDQSHSASKYLTDQFFRKTGLHQWTEGTRIASIKTGTVFLSRLANDILDNGRMKASSVRYLNELGVSDHVSFAKFVRQLEKLDDAGKLALINRHNGKGPQMYRDALARFAEQVIMNPNAGTRPRWANHPLGSVIFNLQSYLYAFHENVTKRALRLAKTAVSKNELKAMDRMHMLAPAMMLPVLTGFQYLIGKPRDEAFKDPARAYDEPMSTGLEIARAISRSNLFGRYDFMANAALSARYDKEPATVMIGPVLGAISEAFKAGVDYFGSKNSPNTNTNERRASRMAYDLGVQPAANAFFSTAPGKVLGVAGAIGIQAASHPATREAFVESQAGPPVAPKKRPDEGNLIDDLIN